MSNTTKKENSETPQAVNLPIFGKTLTVSAARTEYSRMRKQFAKLAEEKFEAAKSSMEEGEWDPDDFCENGDSWASEYIDAVADVAVKELVARGCYEVDRDTYIEKYLDYGPWAKCFEAYRKRINKIDEAEDSREEARQARTYAAKNKWVGFNDEGCKEADWRNMTGGLFQGAKNMIGRAVYQQVNAKNKEGVFEQYMMRFPVAIRQTIATAALDLVGCLEEHGIKLPDSRVRKTDSDKAERLFKNLKSGTLPAEAETEVMMQILNLDPFQPMFYEFVYEKRGDESGELDRVANFFGVSLEDAKENALEGVLEKLASNGINDAEQYRKSVTQAMESLHFGKARIAAKMQEIDAKSKTAFRSEYATVKEAQDALRNPKEFYRSVICMLEFAHAEDEEEAAGLLVGSEIPEKKLRNAQSSFPIPQGEKVIALIDSTLLGSGKTGLAFTNWGVRWNNDSATETRINEYSWAELVKLDDKKFSVTEDDEIIFAPGAVFDNTGSDVDSNALVAIIGELRGFCKEAQFSLNEVIKDASIVVELQSEMNSGNEVTEDSATQASDEVEMSQGSSEKLNMVASYADCMKRYFSGAGRTSRREYWFFFLCNMLLGGFLIPFWGGDLTFLYFLVIAVPSITAIIRRFHDQNRSGWMTLVLLFPYVGILFVLGFMIVPGTKGKNKFGPPRPGC